ncbi:DDE-type integrase/transposase/recombinase [Rossellomorea aquimaris]|uniref:Transposase n=1 Tax=Rossellomorea aquimaris TaxID=189382 RepID=A0A5D4TLC8_9BACI|nr:DDE-type integrase/transposase/recombinase [Rossellomorea aquimaris]TYS76600.1 transposase [Rossellomorea aquimaris]
MGRIRIGRGQRFLLKERKYEIIEELANDKYEVKDMEFGTTRIFSRKELMDYASGEELIYSERGENTKQVTDGILEYNVDYLTDLNEAEQQKALYKYQVIQPILEVYGKERKTRIFQISEEKDVSVASLYRWVKEYEGSSKDIRSLINRYSNSGSKDFQFPSIVEGIITRIIEKYYLVREARNTDDVYLLVYNEITKENKFREQDDKLPIPSKSTIRRRIQHRNSYEDMVKKWGRDKAFQKAASIKRQPSPTRILERVEIDHTQMDIFLLDDEHRLPLGKPFLTFMIDVYSGYPLGYYIGFHHPSFESVCNTLKNAIFNKSEINERYSTIENEWLAEGIPDMIVVDNGKEFIGKNMEAVCQQLGINLLICPVKKPHWKGSVERYFRTSNTKLLHKLPGTTFGNIYERRDYNPEKTAVMTFSGFLEIFHLWLIDSYCHSEHKGVGGIPHRLWESSWKQNPPPDTINKRDLNMILGREETRSIQRDGITFEYLNYTSPELRKMQEDVGGTHPNKFKFKVNYDDLSRIFVYHPKKNKYLEVPCTDQEYTKGLRYCVHKIICKETRMEARGHKPDMEHLAKTRAKIEEMTEKALKETKKSKRARTSAYNRDNKNSAGMLEEKEVKVNNKSIQSSAVKTRLEEERDLRLEEDWSDPNWD